MIRSILNRRSIRKYKSDEVSEDVILKIIEAGMLAPSAKNRQPWKFVAVTGKSKVSMMKAMEKGLEREKAKPLLPGSAKEFSDAENTFKIMRQAPLIIFVINRFGISIDRELTPEERIYEICNAQSIGAAIENMSLAADDLGLGSLWICNTYFSYYELCEWLETDKSLFAALAIGYADESPRARPRLGLDVVFERRK
ncbi:nitroreductase family protein [Ruminococcus sp. Marseille-P6503]|uniref:nitroreductase family protein n=1 Tax=Ruminococcus sp. Marseille-P6503 TaxID=2364796 RepID=UPI000F52830C|nr:nitroreductase family protein [Ruminococcus sp. Marseille-P6503]